MKTFMTTLVLASTVLAAQAQAFGPTMDSLTRDLTFPGSVSETVTQDKTKVGK